MPASWYYGVEPGMKTMFALDGGFGDARAGTFGLVRLRMNDVEVLDLFPYAVDALSIQFEFGIISM